jgi:5,10-methylenetetrahydrofolate reductase
MREKKSMIHLSCKDSNQQRARIRRLELASEGFHNILARVGDNPPRVPRPRHSRSFDIDSSACSRCSTEMNRGLSRPKLGKRG